MTITGSGFGSARGSGQVLIGTAPGQVTSWTDTQVVATISSGSNSGAAQVLQNGVWSNSVAFDVTGAAPHIVRAAGPDVSRNKKLGAPFAGFARGDFDSPV